MYRGKYEKRDNTERRAPAATATPAENQSAATPVRKRKKKSSAKTRRGTILFYSIYAVFVIAFFVALMSVMDPLRDWLVKYEASQPNYKRDEVFTQLFADPDWEHIYQMAGVKDTKFENSKSFAAAMEKLVGDTKLTCLETSAGLSGDKKFIVKLGDEKIASFTLTGGAESQTDIPVWELGDVEVFFQRTKSIVIERFPGQTVYINGVALDDSYIIRTTATIAEDYLPEGLHGYRLEQLQVTDLLAEPEVTLKNADGSAVTLNKNEETGVYTPQAAVAALPTEEEKTLAMNATKTYAEYMIGKSNLGSVQKLFDTKSQFYQTILKSEVGWAQSGASYAFTEPKYSDYYRYSDTLFSIRLEMTLQQTRFDGSVKNYNLNNTLFFQKNDQGKWLVMEATNVAVQQQTSKIRLTFINKDQVLRSEMIDASSSVLTLPSVTAPEGMVFTGWVKQEIKDNGQTTLTVVFEPAENDTVYLPTGSTLEPMTLYALFEEVKAE